MARYVPDSDLKGLVARAEGDGVTPKLYRLWCEHAAEAAHLLAEGDLMPCPACGGSATPVMYRITPQSEPRLWPDWKTT